MPRLLHFIQPSSLPSKHQVDENMSVDEVSHTSCPLSEYIYPTGSDWIVPSYNATES